MTPTRTRLEQLIEATLSTTSFELVLLEYKKTGGDWVLRIFIDHPDGVNLSHCETVTHLISTALDREDLIANRYHLEVSSPGVDRPLVKPSDYRRFVGERVYVKTMRPVEGAKTFTGALTAADENTIEILNENDRKSYRIHQQDVAKATLKPILNFC